MLKRSFTIFFLLAAGAIFVSAQGSVEDSLKRARERSGDIKNRSIELERMKREANQRPAPAAVPRFPQIKEDFEEIQKINSRVVEMTAVKTPINYVALLKSVAEIKDRASRLRTNLFSTGIETEGKNSNTKLPTEARLTDIPALTKILDRSINSFVHSSLFRNTNLVNPQDSLKAQNDLETVIAISSLLKERTKKLKKENFRE